MRYTKCHFQLSPCEEAYSDLLSSLLGAVGFDSFESTSEGVDGYVQSSEFSKEAVDEVVSSFPISHVDISYTTEEMADTDWNSSWESAFEPIRIGDLAYIHPTSYPSLPDVRYDIKINPRMAFGSGSHTTTRLMLRQFLSSNLKGKRVLDVGCGTGILGIGAMLAGASHLTAVDIDNSSVENTIDNLRLNGIEGSEVKEGGIETVGADERFDVILSNIHLNIHLSLMSSYAAHLVKGGKLHLSGFFAEEQSMLQDNAASHGLVLTSVLEEDGWCCMEFQRS